MLSLLSFPPKNLFFEDFLNCNRNVNIEWMLARPCNSVYKSIIWRKRVNAFWKKNKLSIYLKIVLEQNFVYSAIQWVALTYETEELSACTSLNNCKTILFLNMTETNKTYRCNLHLTFVAIFSWRWFSLFLFCTRVCIVTTSGLYTNPRQNLAL